jgi:hypothetical protein
MANEDALRAPWVLTGAFAEFRGSGGCPLTGGPGELGKLTGTDLEW